MTAKTTGQFTNYCYGIVTVMLQKAHSGMGICVWASIDSGLKMLAGKGFQGTTGGFGIIKMLKIGFGGKGLCR